MFTLTTASDVLGERAFNAIIWSFTSFAIVATAIRLYTRSIVVKAVGLDDALILFGQAVAIGLAAVATWHFHALLKSLQSAFFDLQAKNTTYLSAFIMDAIHTSILPIIKCSILAFYKRIAPSRKQRVILHSIALFILIQAIICLVLLIFSLDPATTWLKVFDTPHNIRFGPLYVQITNSAFQVTYDVILLLLPLPVIINTKFKGRDRAGLIFIYILCCFSLVATVIRLTKITNFLKERSPFLDKNQRVEYVYWSIIEVMTAVTCANMPAMSSFVRHISQITLKRSSISRMSERTSSLLQTILKRGTYQSHYDTGEREKQNNDKATSPAGTSEKKQTVIMEDFKLCRNSHTEESSCKSQNSLLYQRSISTPSKHSSPGFLANLRRKIISLLPFKNEKPAVADSAVTVETASFGEGRHGVIYRTDEFGVERSMV